MVLFLLELAATQTFLRLYVCVLFDIDFISYPNYNCQTYLLHFINIFHERIDLLYCIVILLLPRKGGVIAELAKNTARS